VVTLRDLDEINPSYARADRMVLLAGCVSSLISGIGLALANGAAPKVSIVENPVALFCLAVIIASLTLAVVSILLRWRWRAELYGIGMILLGSMALLGGIPWLCFLVYSTLPAVARSTIFLGYIATLIWWSWRFVVSYRENFAKPGLVETVYQVEDQAVFYIQKGDERLLQHTRAPQHFPPASILLFALFVAIALLFIARTAVSVVGLPFVHIFLGVSALPLDMAGLSFAVRGWLIYIHYPRKLAPGRRAYVDLATKPLSYSHQPK
jgi:hypothetical protein